MSLYLYLVRHAQSADKQSGQSDHDRELTPHGTMQAKQLGKIFSKRQYFFDKIICSTAKRTIQTQQLIAQHEQHSGRNNVFLESLLYDGTSLDYEHLVKEQESTVKHLLLVGHNPSISDLAQLLCANSRAIFQPGGFQLIKFEVNRWDAVSNYNSTVIESLNTPLP